MAPSGAAVSPQTVRKAIGQLERQQARLLEAYLAEIITRDEFERKRHELTRTRDGLNHQLRQLDAQAQKHIDLAALAVPSRISANAFNRPWNS